MAVEGVNGGPAELHAQHGVPLERHHGTPPPPPAVSWLAPNDGATLAGSQGLAVRVTSQVTVVAVQFLDNSNGGALIGTGVLGPFGWSIAWDTTTATEGVHVIAARATDSLGQSSVVTHSFTVDNIVTPPNLLTVGIVAPGSGATVTGVVGLDAVTTDNSPNTVTGVQYFANGVLIGSATSTLFGWALGWDTGPLPNGSYTIMATATDSTNATASDSITLVVANAVAVPVVSIAAPGPNTTTTGSVGLDAIARSSINISGVQFFRDGVLIANATLTLFGWTASWDTTTVADGVHLLTAVATDALSQSASASISVTVANNVVVPPGIVMPTNSSTDPAVAIDPTDTRESTMGIRNWIANNTQPGDIIRIPGGTYWVDAPWLGYGSRTFEPEDYNNPPVFHRHTLFQYRVKPDLRPTLSGAAVKVAVPAYWNPPSAFDTQLDNAGTAVGFAVINVNSGPDSSGPQSAYTTQIANNRAAGIKSYGYVHTSSGSRALATCETEIDHWYQWYALDGIFFDEAPGTGWTSGQKTYYTNLFNYVRAKTGANVRGKTVILNPGTVVDQFAMNVCDVVCDYEDTEANYQNATFPTWRASFPASRFWHIVISSAGVTQMQHDLTLAGTRNAGYVYVTQDGGSNPYDTLPSSTFWAAELAKAATVGVVANPSYNPGARSSSWQYDLLGGQANIPTSLSNPNQGGLPARDDTGCTVTNGSPVVLDPSIRSADQTRAISSGGGIPSKAFVGTVTPGVSFLISSSSNGQVNKNATANGTTVSFPSAQALGSESGGYDATTIRSADGTQVIGLRSLYGALWSAADVTSGLVIQWLVASSINNQSFVSSVSADGKQIFFSTPVASSSTTHEGSEGTVAWCMTNRLGGWKVEHQTNDLLSYYVGPVSNSPWSGYMTALSMARNSQQEPIISLTDSSAVTLDTLVMQHCNDDWRNTILNFEKADPVVTEFMRCLETTSSAQVVKNCQHLNPWGAGDHGPAQAINNVWRHCGMQAFTGHWDNKRVIGGVAELTHHSIIDVEDTNTRVNVLIDGLICGGPKEFMALQSEIDGLTVKNVRSTQADVDAGTISSRTSMWASDTGLGYTVPGKNHSFDTCVFEVSHRASDPAITATNVVGLSVTNCKIPTTAAFVKYGASTNVTSTGNDGGNGVGSTVQKAP